MAEPSDQIDEPNSAQTAPKKRSGSVAVLGVFCAGLAMFLIMYFSFQGFERLDVDWVDYGWIWNPTRDE